MPKALQTTKDQQEVLDSENRNKQAERQEGHRGIEKDGLESRKKMGTSIRRLKNKTIKAGRTGSSLQIITAIDEKGVGTPFANTQLSKE